MAINRPKEFLKLDEVQKVIEASITSAYEWLRQTSLDAGETMERIEHLNSLTEILIVLKWRYGENKVIFKFTRSKKMASTIAMGDMLEELDNDGYWSERIWIDENIALTKVYINF